MHRFKSATLAKLKAWNAKSEAVSFFDIYKPIQPMCTMNYDTPTPWLMLLLVNGKSLVKQNLC